MIKKVIFKFFPFFSIHHPTQEQYRDAELIIGNPSTARFKKVIGGGNATTSSKNKNYNSPHTTEEETLLHSSGYFGVATVDVIPNFQNNNDISENNVINQTNNDLNFTNNEINEHENENTKSSDSNRNIKGSQKLFSCEQDCFTEQ